MKPGETVVAAVGHRDYILAFGSQGTVLRIWWDGLMDLYKYQEELDICY